MTHSSLSAARSADGTDRECSVVPLIDAAVFQWHFCFGAGLSQPEDEARAGERKLRRLLGSAFRWAGADENSSWSASLLRERLTSVRLDAADWTETDDGSARCFEARTLLDAVSLLTGVAIDGPATESVWKDLRDAQWSPSSAVGEGDSLGCGYCLTAELDRRADGADIRAQATEIFTNWSGRSPSQVETVQLPFGYFAVPVGLDSQTVALLPYNDEESKARRNRLLYSVVPPLLLARVKIEKLLPEFEDRLLPQVRGCQHRLERNLKRFYEVQLHLDTLEELSEDIALELAEFAELSSRCEDLRETFAINVQNVERLLEHAGWCDRRTELDQLLAAPVRLRQEQMDADIRYLQISRDQADRVLQSTETMAGIRASKWGRLTAIVMSVFTVMAVPDVFPDSPIPTLLSDTFWKISLISVGVLLVGCLNMHLSRKDSVSRKGATRNV